MTAAAVTADDLAVIRQWCGSAVGEVDGDPFGAADLAARRARLHTAEAVALEVCRQIRADFVRDPARMSLGGDYTEDTTGNLAHLDRSIGQLEGIVGDGTGLREVHVTRFRRAAGARR